jgi:DNA-binding NtrC family response regulator
MAKVLIVDDEIGMRRSLSRILEAEGHSLQTAEDAIEAQQILMQGNIDIVVTDIIMPKVSGVDLLKIIREKYPAAKVILITGEPTVDTAIHAVRSGAFDYIAKPVDKESICKVVSRAATLKSREELGRRS